MLRRARDRSFPLNPVFGTLLKSHPAAQPFHEVPRSSERDLYAAIPFAGVAAATAALLVWMFAHPNAVSAFGFPGFLAGFVLWAVLTAGSLSLGLMLARKRRRRFDRRRLGPPGPGETYVGIAYAEGFWTLLQDPAWDRGYLSVSPDGIRFKGYASEIALPAHAIRRLRLEVSRMAPHDRVPRLFIDWTSPDGEESTLSLDTRPDRFGSKAIDKIVALQAEIQTALEHSSDRPVSPQWPPAVRLERLDLRASKVVITLRDLSIFAVGVVPGILLSVAIRAGISSLAITESLRRTLLSGYGYLAPSLPMLTAIGIFCWYLTRKYKSQPLADQTVADPVPLPTANPELPSEANYQSLSQ